ncbi:SAM-dependent methyltransferase [Paenibacillus sp. MBLB4367]|uniref:SAM-dependent methyltransferase n=1 Tax=Paenibacillus sp. MBLB4367 TaxID=3384767 RepID=UPI0039080E22
MAGSMNLIVSVLAAGGVFLAMVSIVYASWRNGISPMPSSLAVRTAVAAEVNGLTGNGPIVEAGSGWGTMAFHLARHCRGRRVTGIENSPVPLWFSRLAARWSFPPLSRALSSRDNVTFVRGNLYDYPYEKADVVVCYLYPGAMKRLSRLFGKSMKPGARIISVCFALPGWRPERVVTCGDPYRTKVYVYAAEPYSDKTGDEKIERPR